MILTIQLSPEVEHLPRERAAHEGEAAEAVAAAVLAEALSWDEQDVEESIEGIQRGLDNFDAGRSRLFADFAREQRAKL